MTTHERAQVSALLDRLDEAPERLIVVTGPRRTGKTTLVPQALGRIGCTYGYPARIGPRDPCRRCLPA